MAQSHLSSPLILGQAGQDWLSACLKATQEVFYTLQSWRGCRGCKPPELPQPLLSAILSTALLCSPALLMTPALVTRNPLQLLLLEVKEQLKSEKKKILPVTFTCRRKYIFNQFIYLILDQTHF